MVARRHREVRSLKSETLNLELRTSNFELGEKEMGEAAWKGPLATDG